MSPARRFHLLALLLAPLALAAGAADLAAVADEWSVELTTIGRRSGEPRTVTIWFVVDGGRVYVQSGKEGKTDWYRNLLARPEAKLRIGGVRLEGRATPVEDPAETKRIHDLFRSKYWTARISGWLGGGFGAGKVVRIDPVTTSPGEAPPGAAGG